MGMDNVYQTKLVKVQSIIRGFLQRKRYKIQKPRDDGYFKKIESRETLTGIYEKNAPIKKKKHIYKTGAVYDGQWKGGLRHGYGIMTWTDNARFEGNWQYN